jgi:hypothetical protein
MDHQRHGADLMAAIQQVLLALGGSSTVSYRSRLQFGGADASTTFTDDTGKTWTAFGNAQIDTSLGDQRGLFDGSGDYITTPNHTDLVFGTGDFIIRFTARWNSKTGFQTLASKGYSSGITANAGWIIQTGSGDGLINLYQNSTGGATLITGEPAMTVNTGQDYLIEVGRASGVAYIKRDGVTRSSTANATNFASTAEVVVGSGGSATYTSFGFNGWLKDFQIL